MQIDHIHFYVEDACNWRDWFVNIWGFQWVATGHGNGARTEVVASGALCFAISEPLTATSDVARHLDSYAPGVADVALRTSDAELTITKVQNQGSPVLQPLRYDRQECWGTIAAMGSLRHTIIERRRVQFPLPPGIDWDWVVPDPESVIVRAVDLDDIDHLVINVAAGALESTANWYEAVLGLTRQQTFAIETPQSGLRSVVMRHPDSGLQFPLNEPSSPNSQIQEFLDCNRGAGVQHIALRTQDIVWTVSQLRAANVEFLSVPSTYYDQLQQRCQDLLSANEFASVRDLQILIDRPEPTSPALLLQLFTEPIFKQPTFFFEVIERRERAKGFGEGNFQALFQAIEQQQLSRGTL